MHITIAKYSSFLRNAGLWSAVGVCGLAILLFTTSGKSSGEPAVASTEVNLLQGTWSHLPGSSQEENGALRISDTPFAIVDQDGSGGQANPPVNLFGTHVQVPETFTVNLTLAERGDSQPIVQLLGEVPIIFDEFRFERKGMRLELADNALHISLWDGVEQQPEQHTLPLQAIGQNGEDITLQITRQNGTLRIAANGSELGSVPEHAIFANGELWFGFGSNHGSWQLGQLYASTVEGSEITPVDTSQRSVTHTDTRGLQQLAQQRRQDFTIGAAAALAPSVADQDYTNLLYGGDFGSITTENALKWQFVHPQPDVYDFRETDALVALASQNNVKVHGHTLVFGEANPRWAQDLTGAEAEAAMLDHIQTVAGRYKGKMASWDVVNEPLADYDTPAQGKYGLRDHVWYQAMGDEYIAKAFRAARQADPNAKLFINEFGLEEDGERWDTFVRLVRHLKAQGVPIDGVGMQSHIYEPEDRINASVLRKHIRTLAKMGLTVRISEIDVYSWDGQRNQAQQYSRVLQACIQESACKSFTFWIPTDRYNKWKDDDGQILDGEDGPWDADVQPTPAVDAMKRVL